MNKLKDGNFTTRTYAIMVGGAFILMAAATAGTMREIEVSQKTAWGRTKTRIEVARLAEKLDSRAHIAKSASAIETTLATIEGVAKQMGCSGDIGSIRPFDGPDGSGMVEIELTSSDAGKALEFLRAVERESGAATRGITMKRHDSLHGQALLCLARLSL